MGDADRTSSTGVLTLRGTAAAQSGPGGQPVAVASGFCEPGAPRRRNVSVS